MTYIEAKNIDHIAQMRINLIKEAAEEHYPITDATPPWLRMGIQYLNQGREVSEADLNRFDRMGGTDYLDPTLCSSPTKNTIYCLNKD